jgi:beta-lactamase class A
MNISRKQLFAERRRFIRSLAGFGIGGLALGLPLPSVGGLGGNLQSRVNAYVKAQRRRGRVKSDEQTSWSVFDFTTGAKLVSINEDVPRQAASMIKPFIAQAYFYRHIAAPSRFPFSAEVERLMAAMIRRSSNTATNELIARVSDKAWSDRPKEVERILRHNADGIFRQIEIVEYIPKGGRTYRNKASAHDYSRFLHAMWTDRLPNSPEMKHLLALPNADRIRQGTNRVPDTCKILDKTGSTAQLCGNMGIVVAQGRDGKTYPYTMIGIIEKQRRTEAYGHWIRGRGNVIREVSDLVYLEMQQQHKLA